MAGKDKYPRRKVWRRVDSVSSPIWEWGHWGISDKDQRDVWQRVRKPDPGIGVEVLLVYH